ncbi:MAG: hypothetical protein GYA48_15165 [Chloroflexi bacterium]|nr:hypothetical protein [Chloroflexota bacterium]
MTKRFFPFDGVPLYESDWSSMARYWRDSGVISGVLNELEVYADSTGMQVKVKPGRAWIQGHFFESDSEEVLSISEADLLLDRIDRVVLRLDWTLNSIDFLILEGTPAASPTASDLTQTSSIWEIPLAKISVIGGANTINSVDIIDERVISRSVDEIKTELDSTKYFGLTVVLGDGVLPVPINSYLGWVEIPFSCTIQSVRLWSDVAGSITIDIRKASSLGGSWASICGGSKAVISSSTVATPNIAAWTKLLNAGDWISFFPESVTNIKKLMLSIRGIKN